MEKRRNKNCETVKKRKQKIKDKLRSKFGIDVENFRTETLTDLQQKAIDNHDQSEFERITKAIIYEEVKDIKTAEQWDAFQKKTDSLPDDDPMQAARYQFYSEVSEIQEFPDNDPVEALRTMLNKNNLNTVPDSEILANVPDATLIPNSPDALPIASEVTKSEHQFDALYSLVIRATNPSDLDMPDFENSESMPLDSMPLDERMRRDDAIYEAQQIKELIQGIQKAKAEAQKQGNDPNKAVADYLDSVRNDKTPVTVKRNPTYEKQMILAEFFGNYDIEKKLNAKLTKVQSSIPITVEDQSQAVRDFMRAQASEHLPPDVDQIMNLKYPAGAKTTLKEFIQSRNSEMSDRKIREAIVFQAYRDDSKNVATGETSQARQHMKAKETEKDNYNAMRAENARRRKNIEDARKTISKMAAREAETKRIQETSVDDYRESKIAVAVDNLRASEEVLRQSISGPRGNKHVEMARDVAGDRGARVMKEYFKLQARSRQADGFNVDAFLQTNKEYQDKLKAYKAKKKASTYKPKKNDPYVEKLLGRGN